MASSGMITLSQAQRDNLKDSRKRDKKALYLKPKMEVPKFCGNEEEASRWLICLKEFFRAGKIDEDEKLLEAVRRLRGSAYSWFQGWHQGWLWSDLDASWKDFENAFKAKYVPKTCQIDDDTESEKSELEEEEELDIQNELESEKSETMREEEQQDDKVGDKIDEKEREIKGFSEKVEEMENVAIEKKLEFENWVNEKLSLEEALRKSEKKASCLELSIVRLRDEAREAEKVIRYLNEKAVETVNGGVHGQDKGLKLQWPVVAESIGAIFTITAVSYVCYGKSRIICLKLTKIMYVSEAPQLPIKIIHLPPFPKPPDKCVPEKYDYKIKFKGGC